MSARIACALLLAMLPGCADQVGNPLRDSVCSEPQMERVQRETTWCDQHTGFLNTDCYTSALLRNCSQRVPARDRAPATATREPQP